MAYDINELLSGVVGVNPRLLFLNAPDNTLAEITTAGFISNSPSANIVIIQPGDLIFAQYLSSGNLVGGLFTPVFSGSVITLSQSNGGAVTPTIANYIAHFTDTNGTISSAAADITNAGNISAGLSATPGYFVSYPPTAARGTFQFKAANNAANYNIILTHAAHSQATTFSFPDPAAASASILVSTTPSVGGELAYFTNAAGVTASSGVQANRALYASIAVNEANTHQIYFEQTVTAAALASGPVIIYTAATGTARYRIMSMWTNLGGTNFSGGGGDKTIVVNDGTNTYGVIQTGLAQSLVNAFWGVASDQFAVSSTVAVNEPTVAGANLLAIYGAGTTNYSSGSVVISGYLERIA